MPVPVAPHQCMTDRDEAGTDVEALLALDERVGEPKERAVSAEEWKPAMETVSRHTQPLAFRCYAFMDEYRLSLQLVLLCVSIWAMWIFIEVCVPCIFIVTIVSAIFCFEYRLMNIVLWASVIVLWGHGWSLGDRSNGLAISWK